MCDDSNTIVGDGCSRCLIDYGYQCDESALSCHMVTVTCGDSYHSSSEDCEDGNIEPGDGCSDVCAVESGYTCS
jgi:cysteine-rich repeat protein